MFKGVLKWTKVGYKNYVFARLRLKQMIDTSLKECHLLIGIDSFISLTSWHGVIVDARAMINYVLISVMMWYSLHVSHMEFAYRQDFLMIVLVLIIPKGRRHVFVHVYE